LELSGFDATARSARPSFVFCKSTHSSTHSTTSTAAKPTVLVRMPMPSLMGLRENSAGICSASWPGLMKMSWASALMARNMPSVMITTLSGLCDDSTGRMSTRSMSAPPTNATTIEASSAIQMPMPWSVNHQVMKVEKSAISPWAKFNSPVVR
jgi:hypothetical protein